MNDDVRSAGVLAEFATGGKDHKVVFETVSGKAQFALDNTAPVETRRFQQGGGVAQ